MTVALDQGDATEIGEGPVILAHGCNDLGLWGAGFSGAVTRKFPRAEADYREWARQEDGNLPLGSVQLVEVGNGQWVANMVTQVGIRDRQHPKPLSYVALQHCLDTLMAAAQQKGARVQMPQVGAGLAGGDWNRILSMIEEAADRWGVTVSVITLGQARLGRDLVR